MDLASIKYAATQRFAFELIQRSLANLKQEIACAGGPQVAEIGFARRGTSSDGVIPT
jgi:hypothetical protein